MSSNWEADASWEGWLAERFAGYLLQDAAGAPRDPAQVARALARLHGTANAWSTLAELGFLLDPAGGVEPLVREGVPAWLRRVLPTTLRRVEESRGRPRGRADWSRTLRARLQSHDRTLFVGLTPERTFETPGAVVVRWLLEQVARAVEAFRPSDGARGWLGRLSALHTSAGASLSHAVLRHIEPRRPEAWERQHCAQSHDPVLRQAAAALAFHDRLLPVPDPEALQRTVERFALAPTSRPRRFELFALLALVDALHRQLPGWEREDALVQSNRADVAAWVRGRERVRVFYDLAAPAGLHNEVMQRVLGVSAHLRPDIRVVHEGPAGQRELYLDPKCSTRDGYLVRSHMKMLAYVADRPEAFAERGPKAILTTPRRVLAPWRDGEPVAFLDPAGCLGEPLEILVEAWLRAVHANGGRLGACCHNDAEAQNAGILSQPTSSNRWNGPMRKVMA